jgi:iron complex outermembrane receptor protein
MTVTAAVDRSRVFVLIVLSMAVSAFGQGNQDVATSLKNLSLEELMNVEVTSVSKQPEPYRKSAASIQVITQEDIRRSGATTIPEALRLATNLSVAQKTSRNWAITARGFNTDLANKLLVLIDGRTIYTPLFSGVFWDRQDYLLEDIERIEVISGPGGTLWGANAVNGVINIITRSARDSQGSFVEVGGGSQPRAFTGMRHGGMIGANTFFRVYGKYFDRDDEAFPSGADARDASRGGQTGFRIDRTSNSKNAFTLQGDFYRTRADVPTGRESNIGGGNLLGRWTRTFNPASELRLQLYYDRTHLADPVPSQVLGTTPVAPAGTLKDDLDTYDVDLQHRFRLNDSNRIVWGLGYRLTHDSVGNSPALRFVPAVQERNLFSGFAQDELRLTKNLTLTFGTKLEHNDYTGWELEPSGRLQLELTPRQMLWAAVSRSVRAPSRVDRDERLATPNLAPAIPNLLIGGPHFRSETVTAYELGYRTQLGTKVSGSIATFYNDYDHIRSTSLSPVTVFPLFFENNLYAKTYGIELNGNYQPWDWWRLGIGYNFLDEHIHVKPGRSDFNKGLNETADPEHSFHLRSSVNFLKRFEFDSDVRWIDSFHYNRSGVPVTMPSYAELDSRLAFQPTEGVELSVVGRNLFHNQHAEYVISGSNPAEEIRRSVYGKLTVRW